MGANLMEIHPWAVKTQKVESITDSNLEVLGANPTRRYLLIQNCGSKSIFVRLREDAVALQSIEIVSGGKWEPVFVPRESVNIISDTGETSTAYILEGQ